MGGFVWLRISQGRPIQRVGDQKARRHSQTIATWLTNPGKELLLDLSFCLYTLHNSSAHTYRSWSLHYAHLSQQTTKNPIRKTNRSTGPYNMTDTQLTTSSLNLRTSTAHIALTKAEIISLSLILFFVVIGVATSIWLLCHCTWCGRRRRERRRDSFITDGRENFPGWNKNVPLSDAAFAAPGPADEDVQLQPLTRAAVRPSGVPRSVEQHPGEPDVVDEAVAAPVYGGQSQRKNNSRYYSGWSESVKKRFSQFSQIGRAY